MECKECPKLPRCQREMEKWLEEHREEVIQNLKDCEEGKGIILKSAEDIESFLEEL